MKVRSPIVLRAIRRQNGWSRNVLARMLGVSARRMGRVERCEEDMTEDMLRRLEAAVGAKLGQILTSE
jgi:ribosome-binding protein aMBF1 (putative translation factor)